MAAALPARMMMDEQYREHPCDLCGADEPIEVPRCREYTDGQPIHTCGRCGFVYVVRRRSAERIAEAWSHEIFGSGYTAAIPAVTARLTYVAEFLRFHADLRGKRVCEVGAGEGEFLDIIRGERYGALPFGIEPSAGNGARLNKLGIEHFTGTIEQYAESQPAASPFDVVAILWTLENCQDCRRMLSIARSLLRPGGVLVVATGSRLLVPFKKPLHTYLSRNPADTHAFRFSANSLRAMLAVTGLATAQINRYVDHDILCVLATPTDVAAPPRTQVDDPIAICTFFERWHVDTRMYFPDPLT